MFNSFGNILRLTTFGESHGKAIGGVIDGFPSGVTIDMDFVQAELNRRRPGQSRITTSRSEDDRVEFLSGIFEGKSTGSPIGFLVWNKNQHSSDYSEMQSTYRPSHADYTYKLKYGIRDYRGGGRSSARETISRVVGGALAKIALRQLGISIRAYTSQVGAIKLEDNYTAYDLDLIESNPVRCPDPEKAKEMEEYIYKIKEEGDTIGGVVTCVIQGCPIGLGQPVFGKLQSALAAGMLSINAAKAFEYGEGFKGLKMKGSEQNDVFYNNSGRIETRTNHSGGIQGGISNGEDIYFRVAFKPVATVLMEQHTVNIDGLDTTLKALDNEDKYIDNVNFKGWVFTIMRNIFINNYRRVVRNQTIIDQTEDLYHLNLPQDSGFTSPEGSYTVKEITKAINSFSEEYRVPFTMHVAGYKYHEIAEKMDLPLGTVKSRIFFARQRLQEILKDYK